MANRRNQERTRESPEPLYGRALPHVSWASDTIMLVPAATNLLKETATWLRKVIELLDCLDSYSRKEFMKNPSLWFTIYGRRHLARFLFYRCEHLAYVNLEVSNEFAHQDDIEIFHNHGDKTYLSYTLGKSFMSLLTYWGEKHTSVDRICVSFLHLCELEQVRSWTATLEDVQDGINAAQI